MDRTQSSVSHSIRIFVADAELLCCEGHLVCHWVLSDVMSDRRGDVVLSYLIKFCFLKQFHDASIICW